MEILTKLKQSEWLLQQLSASQEQPAFGLKWTRYESFYADISFTIELQINRYFIFTFTFFPFQILKILKGEKKVEEEMNTKLDEENDLEIEDNNNEEEDEDDEVYPDSCAKSHLELALLDIDDDSFTSLSSLEQSSNVSVEEFLKGRWSRSSSLD